MLWEEYGQALSEFRKEEDREESIEEKHENGCTLDTQNQSRVLDDEMASARTHH